MHECARVAGDLHLASCEAMRGLLIPHLERHDVAVSSAREREPPTHIFVADVDREQELDPQELRASGMSNRKGATLRALAERFLDGELSDDSLAGMTDEEIEAALTDVRGIGPWTAHGFLIVTLDRPDVLLSGDLALRRAVQRAYGFDHLPTEDEMVQVAERWRPYRSLAVSYLFASESEIGT